MKKDIRLLSLTELQDLMLSMGEPKFRGKQIFEWLWSKSSDNLDEMTNLSKDLRAKLNTDYAIYPSERKYCTKKCGRNNQNRLRT